MWKEVERLRVARKRDTLWRISWQRENPLKKSTIAAIQQHAEACYPRESCGFVIVHKGREKYLPCENRSTEDAEFELSADDWMRAEDMGEISHIVHSHPNTPPEPSDADKVGIEASGVPWLIVNWPTGLWKIHGPTGYVAPLVGREYVYGVFDCFTLARDWYERERGIKLDIPTQWWKEGDTALIQHFREAGFSEVSGDLQPGDGLLFDISGGPHCAVYLGDDLILHHVRGRLSSRDVYGPIWQQHLIKHLRYTAPEAVF